MRIGFLLAIEHVLRGRRTESLHLDSRLHHLGSIAAADHRMRLQLEPPVANGQDQGLVTLHQQCGLLLIWESLAEPVESILHCLLGGHRGCRKELRQFPLLKAWQAHEATCQRSQQPGRGVEHQMIHHSLTPLAIELLNCDFGHVSRIVDQISGLPAPFRGALAQKSIDQVDQAEAPGDATLQPCRNDFGIYARLRQGEGPRFRQELDCTFFPSPQDNLTWAALALKQS
mmetsp:Transcript_44364/g.70477  ORF Transcript_44364/g.70477 Transcript_44364/m.70477 type:complete len:229 (-) Transcript_44364:1151-1837(-)